MLLLLPTAGVRSERTQEIDHEAGHPHCDELLAL